MVNECNDHKHILMPVCHLIDRLSMDKYGNINVEAIITYYLWFSRKTRNRSSTWWGEYFVEDQSLFSNHKIYVENVQDYHNMLSRIFQ